MFENILVYLDGSKAGEAILPVVAQLAARFGSKIVLLSVVVIPAIFAGSKKTETEIGLFLPEQQLDLKSEDSYLSGIAEQWRKNGLDVECVTVEGPIEESILAYARTYGIGLIAFTAHDHGILNRLIIGSTAGIMFKKSGIPVLSLSG